MSEKDRDPVARALFVLRHSVDGLGSEGPEYKEAANVLEAEIERGRAAQSSLFDAIKHGDEKHRAWLKQAIEDHFAGRPVLRPDDVRESHAQPSKPL